jgi:hypothetical protein
VSPDPTCSNGHQKPCDQVRGFRTFGQAKYLIFDLFWWSRGDGAEPDKSDALRSHTSPDPALC